jgi:hypothetical protein
MNLFTTSAMDLEMSSKDELKMWREARDQGLLWCYSRKPGGHTVKAASKKNSRDPRMESANKKRCNPNTHRCEESPDDKDYCQEVDGACNGMGTP